MSDQKAFEGATSAAAASTASSSLSASAAPPFDAGGLVDLHSHFLPDFYVTEATAAGVAVPDGMPSWPPSWSVESHVAMMDSCGVDKAILSLSSPGVHFGDDARARDMARRVNDFAADVAAKQPRLRFFASLPLPDVGASLDEAIRVLDGLNASGVALMSNARGQYLGDPVLTPLWEALNARSATVFVHPTSPPNVQSVTLGIPAPMIEFLFDTARTVVNLTFLQVPQRFPDIRWIFTHGGGVIPLISDRIDFFRKLGGLDKARPSFSDALPGFWYDLAGTPVPHQMPSLVSVAGTEHLVYGSDYCFTPSAAVRQQLDALDAAQPQLAELGIRSWRDLTTANAGQFWRLEKTS
jgi:6-methylsalicylate decarboxylase